MVTLGYVTADGAATAGESYGELCDTLTFAPGVTTKMVSVPIADSTEDDGDGNPHADAERLLGVRHESCLLRDARDDPQHRGEPRGV